MNEFEKAIKKLVKQAEKNMISNIEKGIYGNHGFTYLNGNMTVDEWLLCKGNLTPENIKKFPNAAAAHRKLNSKLYKVLK